MSVFERLPYGRVHDHGGEFAETEFFHIQFVPLLPLRSRWITSDGGPDGRVGFAIPLHVPSVAAAYLRTWALVAAVAGFVGWSSFAGLAVSAALLCASAWSWTWRARRGERALCRSDFDRVALGSRCDPAWMTDEMRAQAEHALTVRLGKRDDPRPADDVARFGARDLDEAVIAYGLLRISGAKHRAARSTADRLMARAFDALPADGGPFRTATATAVPELGAAIRAAARVHAEAASAWRARIKPRWFQRPRVQLAGLVVFSIGLPSMLAHGFAPPRAVGDRTLDGTHPPFGQQVVVRCDRAPAARSMIVKRDTTGSETLQRLALCPIGKRILLVVTAAAEPDTAEPAAAEPAAAEPAAATTLEGELRWMPERSSGLAPWVDAVHRDAELDAQAYDLYLLRDSAERRKSQASGLVFLAVMLVGWTFWIRGFVRRRQARRAARAT